MTGISANGRGPSATDQWLTPPAIIGALGQFDLDPCAPISRPWPMAREHFTIEDDGLKKRWFGRVWLNPPYSKISPWLGRMVDHDRGTALIFARTETEWFFCHVWARAAALLFIEGRLTFHTAAGARGRYNSGAPSVLAAYGLDDADILSESDIDGAFVPLSCVGQIVAVLRGPEITWLELIEAVVDRAGGKVDVQCAYALVQNHPKAQANPSWKAKVRQTLQRGAFRRTAPATYELAL